MDVFLVRKLPSFVLDDFFVKNLQVSFAWMTFLLEAYEFV